MAYVKAVFIFFSILLTSQSFATTSELLLKEGSLAVLSPPIVNKNYYLLEYGFVIRKKIQKWDYNYNAYVTAALFEDWLDKTDKLRAGGLGFKAGAFFPLTSSFPLYFKFTAGFAKTSLQKQPIFGRDEQSVSKKDMFLLEGGLVYRFDQILLSFTYQQSNVKYFTRNTFISIGVNY